MDHLTHVIQEALLLVLVSSGPPIVVSLAVGFAIAVFQATTQIHEQTLTFAPKMIVIFGVLAMLGPWIGSNMLRFTFRIFDQFPALLSR